MKVQNFFNNLMKTKVQISETIYLLGGDIDFEEYLFITYKEINDHYSKVSKTKKDL